MRMRVAIDKAADLFVDPTGTQNGMSVGDYVGVSPYSLLMLNCAARMHRSAAVFLRVHNGYFQLYCIWCRLKLTTIRAPFHISL